MPGTIETLTIKGEEIPVRSEVLLQAELKFFPDNPRIYSLISAEVEELSQDMIQQRLGEKEHVRQLMQSIRANGGLIDPLIVQDGSFVVLEGNSRLAAYRLLAKHDPARWGKVKCMLLPSDLSEDHVFALLGEYHIIGRKDWAPYEQAGYLYRRHRKHNVTVSSMASEMGLSAREVQHLIDVYAFMEEHHETDVQRWSYYEEYFRSREIKKAREQFPEMDTVIVNKIKSGEIEKAVEMRDKVAKIAKKGGKALKRFLNTPKSLDICYDGVVASGGNNLLLGRLKKFREYVGDHETKRTLRTMQAEHLNVCKSELRRIKGGVEALQKEADRLLSSHE